MNKKLNKKSLKKIRKCGITIITCVIMFNVDTNINEFIILYAEEKKLLFFFLDSFFNTKYNPLKKIIKTYLWFKI